MSRPSRYPRHPAGRQAVLTERQNLKMAESAHAYVRGSTARFYEWLGGKTGRALPDGPDIWICGDCHVGNLGPVAAADGGVSVQIRDFDQAVVGNPTHDLVRLGLSLATAARGSDLPGVTTARMLEQVAHGYEAGLRHPAADAGDDSHRPEAVEFALKEALRRSWKHLLREQLEDTSPAIPLGSRFWPIAPRERRAIDAIFGDEGMRHLVTSLRCRDDDAQVEIVDAAYWMKGCSSLGRLRFAVLARVESASIKQGQLCLLDIKEAVQACAPRARRAPRMVHHGERVVQAARALSPSLGDRMLPAKLLGRFVFVRELLPQDLKIEVERVSRREAMAAAHFLASVVGRAHARQMDRATRTRWVAALKRSHPKSLDAPSWLWTSIVELVAHHESAYLEHCRRYALNT